MNSKLPMSLRRHQSNQSPSANIPDDLIVEILCLLNVKSLMKMKCVSKSWNTLISDAKFVKMHLNRSSQNSHFYALSYKNNNDYSFVPFSVNDLLENHLINLPNDPYYGLIDKDCYEVVGSCNGLVCLLSYSLAEDGNEEIGFRLWNPATRTISDKLGYFSVDLYQWNSRRFMFGYDNSTDTYKVVALRLRNSKLTEVAVLSFGDNIWRNIQSFTATPIQFFYIHGLHVGVHLNCTVNWLAQIMDGYGYDYPYRGLVIISLDLTTETHSQLVPPASSFSGGESITKIGVCVLRNCLCFYHDFEDTNLVIWMMTEFGDDNSWTQFLKFSHQITSVSPYLTYYNLFEYGDTLIFIHTQKDRSIFFYNWRNNRIVKTLVHNNIGWISINNYVESLVSTC